MNDKIFKAPDCNGSFVAGWSSIPANNWLGPDSCRGNWFIILDRTSVNDPYGFWIINKNSDPAIIKWC